MLLNTLQFLQIWRLKVTQITKREREREREREFYMSLIDRARSS